MSITDSPVLNSPKTKRRGRSSKSQKSSSSASSLANKEILNPKTLHYEFCGPIGAAILIIFLPVVTYFLYFSCNVYGCPPSLNLKNSLSWNFNSLISFDYPSYLTLPSPIAFIQVPYELNIHLKTGKTDEHGDDVMEAAVLFSLIDLGLYVLWIVFLGLLQILLDGEWKDGVILRNGRTLKYKINAFRSFVVTALVFAAGSYLQGMSLLLYIADHYLSFLTASVIYSFVQSTVLYISSFVPVNGEEKLLALGGNTGNRIYDFWIGRELNPRILNNTFDLKCFFELRPGLIGWFLLNIALAVKQYSTLGRITDSMVLVLLFEGFYVIDALWNEHSILTTMDITTDGFGFMLTFGDLSWVPFTYSLQARYLTVFPVDLGPVMVAVIVSIQCLGYWIFRGANGQKDLFRRDPLHPKVNHLQYIETDAGSKLLISGWWGLSRHINYFGDWLMAVAWSLPCGFDHFPIPYFYSIYFAVLLVHRFERDEHKCRLKYKKDWDRYCSIVKWKIIPYVF